jgi:natural product biosynthesis luciferase-like monooxygenase protein
MEFALFMHPTYWAETDGPLDAYMQRLVRYGVLAETCGFDSVWTSEHHFSALGGIVPSAPVMLAALSQRTTRVRLGTSVVLLPLHHPIQIAEQLAMVDLLSGGRVEFGVGRGREIEGYGPFGVAYEEAEARQQEGIEAILHAWTGQPFTYHGRVFDFEDLEVWPRPLQQPHPPVWIAATTTPHSFENAARSGFNLMTVAHTQPLDSLGRFTQVYRDAWRESGRDPGAYRLATHLLVLLSEDRAEARTLARKYMQQYRMVQWARGLARPDIDVPGAWGNQDDRTIDRLADEGRVIAGDPDECIRVLRQAHDVLGTNVAALTLYFGGLPADLVERSFHLLSEEVMPRLRPVGATAADVRV